MFFTNEITIDNKEKTRNSKADFFIKMNIFYFFLLVSITIFIMVADIKINGKTQVATGVLNLK